MLTKQQLHDKLAELQADNATLRRDNEAFRSALTGICVTTRVVLGIEAAAEAREAEQQKHGQHRPRLTDRELVVLRLAVRYALPNLPELADKFADGTWPGVVRVPPGDGEEPEPTRLEVAALRDKLDGLVGVLSLDDLDEDLAGGAV